MPKDKPAEFEDKFTFILLKFVLYLILLMPLFFWSIFLFPFITTKILYFRILVELALVLYLFLAFKFPELRPRANWLVRAVWIYVAVILIASIFGLNFYRSFWGTVERGEGIVTILHFAIYFTILVNVMRSQRDWYNYFLFAVTSTAINGLYGLGQIMNLDFLANTTGARIAGTIGNPSFYAAYLLFGIFLSLCLLKEARKPSHKFYLRLVFLFELYLLYKTETRGALIAIFAAFVVYWVFGFFQSQKPAYRIANLLLLVSLLGFGFLVFKQKDSSWVKSSHTLGRLTTISISDITTQSRLDTWRVSWQSWQERFLTGYGYENYNLAFNKHFPARIFKDAGSQIWFDRAHNLIFDVGVDSGILGLAAFFSICVTAFWYLLKLYRRHSMDSDRKKFLIVALGLVAYFIQNLFVFDTQATYLMFYLVLGFIASSYQIDRASVAKKDSQAAPHPGFLIKSATVVLILLVFYVVNYEPALANYNTTLGIKAAKSLQYKSVKPEFEKALSYGTYMDEEIRQRLVDNVLEAINSGQLASNDQVDLLKYTISELRKSLKESPKDVRNHLYLLSVMNRAQGYFPELTDEAIELGNQALGISPTRPQTYFELGQSYFFKKNYDEGLRAFWRAIELNPEPKESHLNYLLGTIISKRKDLEQAEWRVIKDRGIIFNVTDYTSIARAYLIGENKTEAIQIYQKVIKLDPSNLEHHAKLAAIYGDMCDLDNVREEVAKATELNQSFILQGQNFIRELEKKCGK